MLSTKVIFFLAFFVLLVVEVKADFDGECMKQAKDTCAGYFLCCSAKLPASCKKYSNETIICRESNGKIAEHGCTCSATGMQFIGVLVFTVCLQYLSRWIKL
ncbi:hypothetical protein M3Y97_01090000 [Aphelenchoides bicaudatus]|nr:hypothetical protein M3Y97_01090000 [Aphelenchoides bicaudatus]